MTNEQPCLTLPELDHLLAHGRIEEARAALRRGVKCTALAIDSSYGLEVSLHVDDAGAERSEAAYAEGYLADVGDHLAGPDRSWADLDQTEQERLLSELKKDPQQMVETYFEHHPAGEHRAVLDCTLRLPEEAL